jgi:hypothetical protein
MSAITLCQRLLSITFGGKTKYIRMRLDKVPPPRHRLLQYRLKNWQRKRYKIIVDIIATSVSEHSGHPPTLSNSLSRCISQRTAIFSLAMHRDIMQPHGILPLKCHPTTRQCARNGLLPHMNATMLPSSFLALKSLRAEMSFPQRTRIRDCRCVSMNFRHSPSRRPQN